MRVRFSRFFSVVMLAAAAALSPACAQIPTASRIQVGNDFAELPKNDQFEYAKFESVNVATGERRTLEIRNAKADPSAPLKAALESQAAALRFMERQADRIAVPGVIAPAAPATVGPAPPVDPK